MTFSDFQDSRWVTALYLVFTKPTIESVPPVWFHAVSEILVATTGYAQVCSDSRHYCQGFTSLQRFHLINSPADNMNIKTLFDLNLIRLKLNGPWGYEPKCIHHLICVYLLCLKHCCFWKAYRLLTNRRCQLQDFSIREMTLFFVVFNKAFFPRSFDTVIHVL